MVVNQLPSDSGMRYTETNMALLFPEPLNAITAIFFLFIAIFWTIKIKGNFKAHAFLSYCLVLLYIGGIGGSIYHLFRQWPIFIMMDWMPIMLLCLSAGVYFLVQSTRWFYAAFMLLAYFTFQFSIRSFFTAENIQLLVNINYAVMALIVLVPVLKYLIHTNWVASKWVGLALLSFVFALTFRVADRLAWFSFGTHFLWHSFGAVATYCMFNYIYLTQNKKELNT